MVRTMSWGLLVRVKDGVGEVERDGGREDSYGLGYCFCSVGDYFDGTATRHLGLEFCEGVFAHVADEELVRGVHLLSEVDCHWVTHDSQAWRLSDDCFKVFQSYFGRFHTNERYCVCHGCVALFASTALTSQELLLVMRDLIRN